MTSRAPEPFAVRDCALITLAVGRTANGLRELAAAFATVPATSLLHHFHESLLRPSFDDPEFSNDFALWASAALGDPVLAERLAAVDPVLLGGDGERLRTALVEIAEERLAELEHPHSVLPGREFHFLRSQLLIFDAGRSIRIPEELSAAVPDLSTGSVFYHFVDARLRNVGAADDFTLWLASWGDRTAAARGRLSAIDPGFGSLPDLRLRIAEALGAGPREGPA
jgi:hypothetical protein